jgi:hypothetical protein
MRSLMLIVLCGACSQSGKTTLGKNGRASFAFRATPGCEDGCDLESNAVAADGAHQILAVTGADFATADSSAPAIATFSKTSNGVEAVTGMPGDAELILRDAANAEIDRVTVHVVAAATLEFTRGWQGAGPIILENLPITIAPVTKRDGSIRILLGTGAVHFTLTGPLMSLGVPPPNYPEAPGSVIESLLIQGTAGSANLHGQNGAQSFDLPVTVAALADLNKISGSISSAFLGEAAIVEAVVQYTVSTPAGAVFGPKCAWSVSDPSVRIKSELPNDRLDHSPSGATTFTFAKSGQFTATCTVGRLMLPVTLKYDG